MDSTRVRIGIDARLFAETGIGRYIRNLLSELALIDKQNEYVIYMLSRDAKKFTVPNERWRVCTADVSWHSLKEQFLMPYKFKNDSLDIVHIPYFNAPILFGGRFIITIHDVTIEKTKTGKATTLPIPLYHMKRFGYSFLVRAAMRKARHVLTVSETVKREIIERYRETEKKITVTYEGVDPGLSLVPKVKKSPVEQPYILYVGNVYPHKNIDIVIAAFEQIVMRCTSRRSADRNIPRLVLVGKKDFFYDRLLRTKRFRKLAKYILYFPDITDARLAALYDHAYALVFPSVFEGFGLPAIEAVSRGCPVICSDIPVFHEILGTFATFVDSSVQSDWIDAMQKALSKRQHVTKTPAVEKLLAQYSWKELAHTTLKIYERCARI